MNNVPAEVPTEIPLTLCQNSRFMQATPSLPSSPGRKITIRRQKKRPDNDPPLGSSAKASTRKIGRVPDSVQLAHTGIIIYFIPGNRRNHPPIALVSADRGLTSLDVDRVYARYIVGILVEHPIGMGTICCFG